MAAGIKECEYLTVLALINETSYNAISRPGDQYCVLLSGSEMAVLAV